MKLLSQLLILAFAFCATQGLASTVTPTPKTVYGSWDSISAPSVPKGSELFVIGWGADTAATPTATSGMVAKIYVDKVLVAEVPMAGERPDVTKYYGFTNCGFSASINTSALTLGVHTVEIDLGGGPSGSNRYTKPVSGKNTFTVTAPNQVTPVKPTMPSAPRSAAP